MKIAKLIATACLLLASARPAEAQETVSYDYYGTSDLRDRDGDKVGSGSMSRVTAKLTYPLSYKKNDDGIPTLWALSANVDYASLDNDEGARRFCPNEILNTSLTLSHIRPLSGKWGLIAAAGCGIYSPPGHVRWNTVLANVMAVAAYRFNESFSIGGGAGLTNSFGWPMLLPMLYLEWQLKGKYDLQVNFMGRLSITGSMWVAPKWKLSCTPIDMDGMSAVMKVDGRTKIFSMTMLKSGLAAHYYITKRFSAFASVGCVYSRTTKLSKRDISQMYKNIFSSSGKLRYAPAMRISVGLNYGF